MTFRRTRTVLALLVASFTPLVATPASAACTGMEPGWVWNYQGTIGERYRIRMSLVFEKGALSGVYAYATQLADIRLRGRLEAGSRIVLEELGPSGTMTAQFVGTFPERDPRGQFGDSPLQCEVITGTWKKSDGGQPLPFYLSLDAGSTGSLEHRYEAAGVTDDGVVDRKAAAFWNAVKRDDRPAVAALIEYPLAVTVNGRRRRFPDAAALVASYDAVFTAAFRDIILKAIPRYMFAKADGVMLGDGAVWFGADGQVIALNP